MQPPQLLSFLKEIFINWDSEESDELLKMIIKHYVTMRGVSFAAAFMEKYKQSTKKTTQKSKGLRKTLDTSKASKND